VPNFEAMVQGRIGQRTGDAKSMRVLNRNALWTPTGIKYAADQRHAGIIITQLGLTMDNTGVDTPGKQSQFDELESAEEVDAETRSWYRGIIARGSSIAQ